MAHSFFTAGRSTRALSSFSKRMFSTNAAIILGRLSKSESYEDRYVQAWTQAKEGANFDRIGIKTGSDFVNAVVCDGVGDQPNSHVVADRLASSVLDFSHLKFTDELRELSRSLPDNGASTLAALSVKYLPNNNGVIVNACTIGDSFLIVVNSRGIVWSSLSSAVDLKSKYGESYTLSVRRNGLLLPQFHFFTLEKGASLFLGSDGFDVFDPVDDWGHVSTCIKKESLCSVSPWLRSNISEFIETDKDSSGMMLSAIRDDFLQKGFDLNHFNPTHLDDMSLVAIEV